MLILTRRISEKLIVDGKTSVTVLGVRGNQVRLGIEAPKEIEIHREEIYQRILAELEQEKNLLINNSNQLKKPVISYIKKPQKRIKQNNECLV